MGPRGPAGPAIPCRTRQILKTALRKYRKFIFVFIAVCVNVFLTVSPLSPEVPCGPGSPLSPFSPCSPGGPMSPIRPG